MSSSGSNRHSVAVVGAGLAGCEAAWQLAERGIPVRLLEMKPTSRSKAHASDAMAELVCSNSLRSAVLSAAVGLLKKELFFLGSLLMRIAEQTAVPAGRALAVDRVRFAGAVEKAMTAHPLISVERRRVDIFPEGRIIVATGPLTDGGIAQELMRAGILLHYYDAIAPLVSGEGLDHGRLFFASRYEQDGPGDYLNCPLDEREYFQLVEDLKNAEKTPLRDFESAPFFEGCLPVEELAARGPLTLAHGPLKPVGLVDPKTGRRPFAVAQLRSENRDRTAFNLVGFQTRLTRSAQRRVFRTIPGLGRARFERYGQVHRNSFVNAPQCLDERLRLRNHPRVTVAGQLAGVEGYVESIACGLAAGLFVAAELLGVVTEPLPPTMALGGLMDYLKRDRKSFQPSNVVWSMIDLPARERGQSKREHKLAAAQRALRELSTWISFHPSLFAAKGAGAQPDLGATVSQTGAQPL